MRLMDAVKVRKTQQMVWLSEELFLSASTCDCCHETGLTMDNNDDGQNMLGFTLCIKCQEEK